MRIKVSNDAGVQVEKNFKIEIREAVLIAEQLRSFASEGAPCEKATSAELYAVNLMGQIFEYLLETYVELKNPGYFRKAIGHLSDIFGKTETEQVVRLFQRDFPPAGEPVVELAILRLTNENRACRPYSVLFDESELEKSSVYFKLMNESFKFLSGVSGPAENSLDIIEFLRQPRKNHPDSLLDQLEYIKQNWKPFLGDFYEKLLRGIDILKEENKPSFPPGPGPVEEYVYEEDNTGGFSRDSQWMPNVVMMAKSTLVWLDQLSKFYKRDISRLDHIPDEELDALKQRGFTALWLIGLWERSTASKTIKQTCGNSEAESSAYSLKRYEIAEDLGGWEALQNLRYRCETRGIRLASDMVPNHTGLDSDWINEHPDWFIQLSYPPYPGYTFNGQNLSSHPDTGVYLEDHYYDKTDASVVFKHYNFRTGETRYIYHGNDGTSMPWNDTAQLNYLNPEVREAVIQVILHVARNFPIIRFDAAMTLAKKHIQRLWYPEPGTGGDIPTRSEHGLSRAEFNRAIPVEFWREVVERIREELPHTLLLAEAFWMMEGYFVKNLGMHRVYNSAFMNMLKMEENSKYKNTIKNTIAYDPGILKRFVNFMNNPDEDTAAAQFGMGDKYFCVCTMMITMPGLPMFGHGQIEGFREKYGMEYRKAYYDEHPDRDFIERHNREIFPLTAKRYLFSDSDNFNLYDMYTSEGHIDENVFAWSNRKDNEHVLVFANNSYNVTHGWINSAAPKAERGHTTIASDLNLGTAPESYCLFREQRSGLTFIRKSEQLHREGLYVRLNQYESQIFLDFREEHDHDGKLSALFRELNGSGTADLERLWRRIRLRPAADLLIGIFSNSALQEYTQLMTRSEEKKPRFLDELTEQYNLFLEEIRKAGYTDSNAVDKIKTVFSDCLKVNLRLKKIINRNNQDLLRWEKYIKRGLEIMPEAWTILMAWNIFSPLAVITDSEGNNCFNNQLIYLMQDLNWSNILENSLKTFDCSEKNRYELINLSYLASSMETLDEADLEKEGFSRNLLETMLNQPEAAKMTGRNFHQDIEWFTREPFQQFSWWMFLTGAMKYGLNRVNLQYIDALFSIIIRWLEAEEASECRISQLFDSVRDK